MPKPGRPPCPTPKKDLFYLPYSPGIDFGMREWKALEAKFAYPSKL